MWLNVGAPQKVQENLNLQPILNKNSPWAHMEPRFDVFGVVEKVVKYVIHSFQKKKI
jgi:hypothetical protein